MKHATERMSEHAAGRLIGPLWRLSTSEWANGLGTVTT